MAACQRARRKARGSASFGQSCERPGVKADIRRCRKTEQQVLHDCTACLGSATADIKGMDGHERTAVVELHVDLGQHMVVAHLAEVVATA
jgi:hypothetical protein